VSITAVLLAGGQSKRMGKDKAFLKYKGNTFLKIILKEIQDFVDEIILSINKPEDLYRDEISFLNKPVKFVKDIDKFGGPLNAVVSCANEIETDSFFLLTCDTPLFKGTLISYFQSTIENYDCVIPVINGKYQPINTIYKKDTLEVAKDTYLNQRKNSLFAWINRLNVKYVDEEEIKKIDKELGSYFSVNTPKQYQKLLEKF